MTSTMAPRQIVNEGIPNPMQAWGEEQVLQVNNRSMLNENRLRKHDHSYRFVILFTLFQLDESVVTPGFAYNLARYFPSGTHNDKERCLELMDKIGGSSDPAAWYSTGAMFLAQ